MVRESTWVTFWNRRNKTAIALCSGWPDRGSDYWTGVEYDFLESKPGIYNVWRDIGEGLTTPEGVAPTGDVFCIEVHLDDDSEGILGFPDHLLDRRVLGPMTLWVHSEFPSFMSRSYEGDKRPRGSSLTDRVEDFGTEVSRFPGFSEQTFQTLHLLQNPHWDWGKKHGVYCFISEGTVVYVGRALGSTLGDRIWNQLHSKEDPEWKAVVEGQQTQVRVFFVDDDDVYMASAFEAFLIGRLDPHPYFNRRKQ